MNTDSFYVEEAFWDKLNEADYVEEDLRQGKKDCGNARKF